MKYSIALRSLAAHEWYGPKIEKMNHPDWRKCESVADAADKLGISNSEFEEYIARLWIDMPDKPKNAMLISEILSAANTVARKE